MNIHNLYKFLSPKFQTLFLEYPVKFKPLYLDTPHPLIYEIISRGKDSYAARLSDALKYKDNFIDVKASSKKESISPTWLNGFLPGLDTIALYYILAEFRPKKYIEVGSGNSTKVAYKSISENNLDTEIISIDPYPRAEIDRISSRIIRVPFENIEYDLILNLEENDVLFIDNSHRILPNSDSLNFYLKVLPFLKKGVIVHIHDVYLPYDYPQFMCDRAYSEQYGLAFYLIANPERYRPILPNYYIYKTPELHQILAPFWDNPESKMAEKHGGSFWMQIS